MILLKTLLKRDNWDYEKCGKNIVNMFVAKSYNSLLNLILLFRIYITNVKYTNKIIFMMLFFIVPKEHDRHCEDVH